MNSCKAKLRLISKVAKDCEEAYIKLLASTPWWNIRKRFELEASIDVWATVATVVGEIR